MFEVVAPPHRNGRAFPGSGEPPGAEADDTAKARTISFSIAFLMVVSALGTIDTSTLDVMRFQELG
jgi:hypothetical protein